MKKTEKETKKLALNRETVRLLNDGRLSEVLGAGCTGFHCETDLGGTCCQAH